MNYIIIILNHENCELVILTTWVVVVLKERRMMEF